MIADLGAQLGSGAVVAAVVLTLREILPYVGKKKNGVVTNGSQSIDFWKLTIRESVSAELTPYVQENRQVLSDIRDGINRVATILEIQNRG